MKKVLDAGSLVLSGKRDQDERRLSSLDSALQAFFDGQDFRVELLKPATFAAFLALEAPSQGIFNQLTSEIPSWELIDEIEKFCF
ncbi:MAG: hypothetical protein V1908_04965, partial [Candidatus Peregrinibacteria bacterium]